ncbi:hypothetical protein niasHT_036013 [Heterodera trifolii]|uniref:Uncharacterized protein n=1 Tax=Heterodera trifolii TaxID=157864 RepID=A0ABD2I7W5_9BILA
MVVVPFLRYCGWKTEQISLRGARPSGFKCLLALVLGIERTGDAEIKVGGGVGIRASGVLPWLTSPMSSWIGTPCLGTSVLAFEKNTRHKRPKAFGLRKCPNREIRSARVSACALALGAVSSDEMVLPKSGKLGCLASAVSLQLARLPSPMRTLALNGVVSAETIRLNETAVIAALGNAR